MLKIQNNEIEKKKVTKVYRNILKKFSILAC